MTFAVAWRLSIGMRPQVIDRFHELGIPRLSVSNSWSGGDGELDEVPAMGDPAHMIQVGRDRRVSTGEGQRRMAVPTEKAVLVAAVDVASNDGYASGPCRCSCHSS
jgi:hypothetical protein